MNRNILLTGTAVLALLASAVSAAEIPSIQVASGETNDQKCARWAGYQGLKGATLAEYVKDCQLELRVPDKEEGGGDD